MSESPANEDPVLRSHEEARRNYDRLSGWYDLLSGNAEWGYAETALALLDPKPGESVLEIGFGTGKALEWIGPRVEPGGRAVGVDLSEGMRAVAARRLSRAGIRNVELVVADALSLPFEDGSFDALFMGFTLELFDTPELPVVMAEVRRVLHAGGRLAIAALSLRRIESRPVRVYRWVHRRFPRAVDCRPIPLRRIVATASFEIRELREEIMWGLPLDLLLAARPPRDS